MSEGTWSALLYERRWEAAAAATAAAAAAVWAYDRQHASPTDADRRPPGTDSDTSPTAGITRGPPYDSDRGGVPGAPVGVAENGGNSKGKQPSLLTGCPAYQPASETGSDSDCPIRTTSLFASTSQPLSPARPQPPPGHDTGGPACIALDPGFDGGDDTQDDGDSDDDSARSRNRRRSSSDLGSRRGSTRRRESSTSRQGSSRNSSRRGSSRRRDSNEDGGSETSTEGYDEDDDLLACSVHHLLSLLLPQCQRHGDTVLDLVRHYVAPATAAYGCSYVDFVDLHQNLGRDHVGPATAMLSYSWSCKPLAPHPTPAPHRPHHACARPPARPPTARVSHRSRWLFWPQIHAVSWRLL